MIRIDGIKIPNSMNIYRMEQIFSPDVISEYHTLRSRADGQKERASNGLRKFRFSLRKESPKMKIYFRRVFSCLSFFSINRKELFSTLYVVSKVLRGNDLLCSLV